MINSQTIENCPAKKKKRERERINVQVKSQFVVSTCTCTCACVCELIDPLITDFERINLSSLFDYNEVHPNKTYSIKDLSIQQCTQKCTQAINIINQSIKIKLSKIVLNAFICASETK